MKTEQVILPQYLKASAIAKMLNVSTKTIHRWHAAGHYPANKINPRIVLFNLADVMAFVNHYAKSNNVLD